MDFGGAPQSFGASFRKSERAYFPGRNQSGHGADSVFNRNFRIDAVLIEEIDRFDAKPFKAAVASAPDIFRRTVDAPDATGIEPEPEFCGNHHTVARHFSQKSAQQLFIGVGPVDLGGVKKIAAELQITVKNTERFPFISGSVSKGHAHAPKS